MLRKIMIASVAIAAIGAVAMPTDVSARGGHGGSHGGYRGGYSGGYRGGYYGGYGGYGLGYYAYPYPYYSDPYSYGPPPAAEYESGPAYVAPGPGPNGSGYDGPPPGTERGPAYAAPGPGPNGPGRQCWIFTDKNRGFGYYRPC